MEKYTINRELYYSISVDSVLVTSLECYKPGGIVGTDNADLPGSMTFHNTQLIYSGVVRNIYWTLHTYYYVPNLSVTWDTSYGNWVSYNTGH